MVIVIAVVAILTAVLIPTFASIIDKANMSADQVAVKNMNTILTTEDNPENDRKKVLEILSEAGFNTEHLIPTSANHKFYWNSTYNMVLLVNCKDENNKIVVFPLGVEEVSKDFYEFEYLSYDLSHILPVAEIEIIKDLQIDDETILDTAVTFFATEERATEEYANWIADFTISFNKDFSLAENEPTSEEIVLLLAGQYDAYSENWLIINPTWVSVYNIEANKEIMVLDTAIKAMGVSGGITYADVCNIVKKFSCGIKIKADPSMDISGTEISLDLRIYEPLGNDELGNSYVIKSYKYKYE